MDTLIIILVAAAVAVVAWTFFQVVTGAANAPKRKLQQRLSSQSGIQSTGVGPQPSIRLLEKVGFAREGYARRYLCIDGRWQDHLLYGLVRDDPRR